MHTFGLSVLEDVVANILTAALLILGAVLFWYARLTSYEQRWRRWIHPQHRIFAISVEAPMHWQTISETAFVHPARSDEQERLITWYSQRMQTRPTNGQVVRLDSIDPWIFSEVKFFDFLTTNLTAFPANWPHATLVQHWFSWWHWWSIFRSDGLIYF
jgi:hypothetical protein